MDTKIGISKRKHNGAPLKVVQREAPNNQPPPQPFLIVKRGNQWLKEAQQRPAAKMLCGELFFEGELCILFADTNMGKSILAVQIADAISRGRSSLGLSLETAAQPVLYFDFELSDKQFQTRYTDVLGNLYQFDDRFMRAEINPDVEPPEGYSFEECVTRAIEDAVRESGVKVLVIDNITYLKSGTEKARDALPLMKELKQLKRKHDLSVLILAHTPKRNLTAPITRNDLQGSKMLINFCDSAFAIGESHNDSALRYVKQVKARNTEVVYNTDNVIVCEIRKESNFLEFDFREFGSEFDHLKRFDDTEDRDSEIYEAYQEKQSMREVGAMFGVSRATVNRIVKKMSEEK